jgi:hypothetical protein
VNTRTPPHTIVLKPAHAASLMQVLFGLNESSYSQTFADRRDECRVLLSERGKACDPHSRYSPQQASDRHIDYRIRRDTSHTVVFLRLMR